jgi:ATP-dependent DNA helicase RecG
MLVTTDPASSEHSTVSSEHLPDSSEHLPDSSEHLPDSSEHLSRDRYQKLLQSISYPRKPHHPGQAYRQKDSK